MTSLSEERLSFYLHQVLRADDVGADQRVGRQDAPEAQTVGVCNRFHMILVLEVDACADDIFEACPEALQCAFNLVDHKMRLSARVVAADNTVAMGCGSTRNNNTVAAPHGAAVTGHFLPDRAAKGPAGAVFPGADLIRRLQRFEVIAEIPGSCQVRRTPVLIAAIARDLAQSRHGLIDLDMIGFGRRVQML